MSKLTQETNRIKNGLIPFIYIIIAITVLLIISEMYLKYNDYKSLTNEFHQRSLTFDTLSLYYDFSLDDYGAMSISYSGQNIVSDMLKEPKVNFTDLMKIENDIVIKTVVFSYHNNLIKNVSKINVIDDSSYGNIGDTTILNYLLRSSEATGYKNFIDSLKTIEADSFQQLLISQYTYTPINEFGYRTVSLDLPSKKPSRKRVLIIGDSFTFGFSAFPFTLSFPDYLNTTNKFEAINLGIPGADPAQYLAICKRYIQVVKPDVVLICFNLENDILNFYREADKSKGFIYPTDAGWLHAYTENGVFLKDHHEALNYWFKNNPNNYNYFLSETALGALIVKTLNNTESETIISPFERDSINKEYLSEIKQICDENSVQLKIGILPLFEDYDYNSINEHIEIFKDLDYGYLDSVDHRDFSEIGTHLSVRGHYRFGKWLEDYLLE